MSIQLNPALTVAEKADLRDAPGGIFRNQVYTVKAPIDVRFHLFADNGIVGRFGGSASTVNRVDQYFPENGYAGVLMPGIRQCRNGHRRCSSVLSVEQALNKRNTWKNYGIPVQCC